MRLLFQLLVVWTFVTCLLGFFGATWVDGIWKRHVESTFKESVAAAVKIVESKDWQTPVEDDPRWDEIEADLNIGLVPFDAERRSSSELPEVQWSQVAQDSLRLTQLRELDSEQLPISNLIVNREVQRTKLGLAWWLSWLGLNVVAYGLALVAFFAIRRDKVAKKRVLTPWFKALETEKDDPELLPSVEALDSDFCLQMDSVADSVNRIFLDLRNANERSDLVLGNLREGVLAVDESSRILLANRALRKLLDIPDDNLLYRPLLEVIRTPAIAKLVDSVLQEQLIGDESIEYGPKPKHLRLIGRPLPLGDDRTGALVTIRDESLLKRVDMIKKEFISNAGHELKTPLAAIRGYAETLQLGALEDPEAADGFVNSIIGQADRLDHLVQGMLQLSKVEEGVSLKYRKFNVFDAISPCVEAARGMSRAKDVSVVLDTTSDPLTIKSDRDAFQTIASNLLSNGVRYTEPGGKVEVTFRQDDRTIMMEVSDDGIGIKEEDIDRVFERFYRAEKDRSSETGGTGLGLSMVKHLAAALGGAVKVESEVGRGSVFSVELPNAPGFEVGDE